MPLLRRLVLSALAAGLVAGVAASLMQLVWVTPLMLDAEAYETARETLAAEAPAPAAAPWPPLPGDERIFYSLVGNTLAGVAYGLLLAAGMTLSRADGVGRGVLWGAAAYAALVLAPALGLPPELPGMAAGNLPARQTWWLATAVTTAAGLGLLVWAPLWLLRALGLGLLLVPHIVGAPVAPPAEPSLLPPDLVARFVAAALVTGAVFWALLGVVCGAVHARLRGGPAPGGWGR